MPLVIVVTIKFAVSTLPFYISFRGLYSVILWDAGSANHLTKVAFQGSLSRARFMTRWLPTGGFDEHAVVGSIRVERSSRVYGHLGIIARSHPSPENCDEGVHLKDGFFRGSKEGRLMCGRGIQRAGFPASWMRRLSPRFSPRRRFHRMCLRRPLSRSSL